jgi:hypothetical protein
MRESCMTASVCDRLMSIRREELTHPTEEGA